MQVDDATPMFRIHLTKPKLFEQRSASACKRWWTETSSWRTNRMRTTLN
jgi:hypothetical protein